MKNILIVVSLIILACPVGEKISLKIDLKPGDRHGIIMTTEQKISQEVQGKKMDIDQIIKIGYLFDVTGVDSAGNLKVAITYKRIGYRISSQLFGSFEYDSERESGEVPPQAVGYAALVGKKFTMVMTPSGKVKRVLGLEEMFDKIGNDLKLPPGTEEARGRIIQGIRHQFGGDAMKELLGRTFDIFPDDSVSVGQSWEKRMSLKMFFPVIITSRYTLKSATDSLIHLLVLTEVKPNPAAGPLNIGEAILRYELTGTMEGEIFLDRRSCMTRSGRLNQVLTGKMMVTPLGPGSKTTEVPIDVQSKITFEPL